MTTRKQIRDAIAAAIESHDLGISVFSGRHITQLEDAVPAVSILFDDGEIEHNLYSQPLARATVLLSFVVDCDDDGVDALADAAIEAVVTDPALADIVMSGLYNSFEYDREIEPPYTGFTARIGFQYRP